MNRLKKIFAALRELAAEPRPGTSISNAWDDVKALATARGQLAPGDRQSLQLVDKVIAAVVAIADDAEKKGGDAS